MRFSLAVTSFLCLLEAAALRAVPRTEGERLQVLGRHVWCPVFPLFSTNN